MYCRKQPFKSKKLADIAREDINANPTNCQRRKLLESYKCNKCGEWHNTSISKRIQGFIEKQRTIRETEFKPGKDKIKSRLQYLQSKDKHGNFKKRK